MLPLSIYVAGPLPHVKEAAELAAAVKERLPQVEIVSSWHSRVEPSKPSETELREYLLENLCDMSRADVLVVQTWQDSGRETYVEVGRFLALAKPVIWYRAPGIALGDPLSGFALSIRCSHGVEWADDLDQLAMRLRGVSNKLRLAQGVGGE